MRITDVRIYLVPPEVSVTPWVHGDPWVLVEIQTDAGIRGWGQAHTTQYGREHAIARMVHELAPLIIGTDPMCVNRFRMSATQIHDASETGVEGAAAAAGIELALWDIAGKALDRPVHDLLGGACRDRIHLYANCWSDQCRTPDELACFAARQAGRGFRAVKLYPFLHGASTAEGIESIRAVRDTVGPEVDIFIDLLGHLPPGNPIDFFGALRAQRVSWLEDPAPADATETLASIRRQSGLPVVTGEALFANSDFIRICAAQAADVLNPEVAILGILGVREVAAIAQTHAMQVTIHNANTMTIGLAAAVQAAAITPNSKWVEFFPTLEDGSNSFARYPLELDEQGTIALPRTAGLGVEVDQAALDALASTMSAER